MTTRSLLAWLDLAGASLAQDSGAEKKQESAYDLIAAGWDQATPAAIVADGTLPQQQVWRGTLGELAADVARLDVDGPALILIGQVAALDLRTTLRAGTSVAADMASASRTQRFR